MDDELGLLAHPRGVISARDRKTLLEHLKRLVNAQDVTRFVVGLPLDMSGGEGDAARKARAFGAILTKATQRPVEFWDERLTTAQAHRVLAASDVRGRRAKERVDEVAACTILQAWLDAHRDS
jgi:putative Holliday junction resolvase